MNKDDANVVLRTLPIASWKWPRILLGVPIERALSHASQTFFRFMEIASQGVPFVKQDYTRTDLARNRLAMELLKGNYTHLLMLDSDHIHPVDIVQRLARWVLLDPDKLVVGGLNFRRSVPHEPCAFFYEPDGTLSAPATWTPGLMRVDVLGTGSMMIAREVFETLEPPWFWHIYDENIMSDVWPGEDIGFCKKCNAAGIDLWMDTTTSSPHLTDGVVTEASFREYLKDHPENFREFEKELNETGETV